MDEADDDEGEDDSEEAARQERAMGWLSTPPVILQRGRSGSDAKSSDANSADANSEVDEEEEEARWQVWLLRMQKDARRE